MVDGDTVEESNLHRQILHSTSKVGMPKVESALRNLKWSVRSKLEFVGNPLTWCPPA